MKKCLLLFPLVLCCLGAKTQFIELKSLDDLVAKVTYNFKAKTDSTILEFNFNDELILFIGSNHSRFVSSTMLSIEQTMLEIPKDTDLLDVALKSIDNLPSIRPSVRFEVYKDRVKDLITRTDVISDLFIKTEEPLNSFKWNISPETRTFFGYKVQKATTNYGCRDWVAWFTPDLPWSEGPYKFNGLPGLIVMVSDTKGNFLFEISGLALAEKGEKVLQNKDVESFPLVTKADLVKARLANRRLHPGRQDSPQNIMPRPHLPVNPIELCAD